MATIDSKNLLVWVKAMSRGQALPLDASEIHESLAAAQTYAASAIAYEGQTIKAKLADGKYHEYIIQPSDAGYVLEETNVAVEQVQYVMIVDGLPESGQIEGIIYIDTTDYSGYIYTGSAWKKVFWDITADAEAIVERMDSLEDALDEKAPIANPVFSGVVKVGEDEVALKSYVESLFANLVSAEPGIVDSSNPLPADYKAGMHFRVAEDGTYAGVDCEVGDLILVVKSFAEGTASNDDFMVLQANIDGAVTSASDVTTVGEIVVFDSVTGKVIKGAGVQIASLNDAIAKAHEHTNKTVLDSYDKSQAELLAAAKTEAGGLVSAHETAVTEALKNKADKGTTLAEYGITDAYSTTVMDEKLRVITENLNSKVSASEVDTKIADAKTEILEEAATNADTAMNEKIGDIGESDTVVAYIDRVVSAGGSDVVEQIDQCLEDSKTYTDDQIAAALAVVEF